MNTIKVGYRDIAKMFAKSLPLQGDDFSDKVEEYIEVIKALPVEAKVALRTAYIFASKVPREDQEDFYQDLCLAVLKAKTKDEKLAYTIARCDWQNWWSKYKIRQHYSLNSVVKDSEGNQVEFGELLVGECEFEAKINGELDGASLYEQLPKWVRDLVDLRLRGEALRGGNRQILDKWVASKPMILAQYQN